MMSQLCFALLHIFLLIIIYFIMLFWMELSGTFLWLIDEAIAYRSQKFA